MKKFYKNVEVQSTADGYVILLDGKVLKTPTKADLTLPTRGLAQQVAAEWKSQGEEIKPAEMWFMRLVSTAIDRVADRQEQVLRQFRRLAENDLLYYRAGEPKELSLLQSESWDPVLAWAQQRFDVSFQLAKGIMPTPQSNATLDRLEKVATGDVFRLTGLAHGAALLSSPILVLALAEKYIDSERAYELSLLDELYQLSLWGEDEDAKTKRDKIKLEIDTLSAYFISLNESD